MALVKVKIMAHVGHYLPGQEVEVEEAIAQQLCASRKRSDGHGLIDHRCGMLLSEFEERKNAPVDKNGLTQGELTAMGLKNIVVTPPDSITPSYLKGAPAMITTRDPDADRAALDTLPDAADEPVAVVAEAEVDEADESEEDDAVEPVKGKKASKKKAGS